MYRNRSNIGASIAAILAAYVLCGAAPAATPPKEPPPKVVQLERLEPTAAEVLTPPELVKGDFDVAKAAPKIDFCILPYQWEGGKLWSNWGNSIYASDGKFYCTIGDHDGPHGYCYVYKIDPEAKTAEMIVDYNKTVGMPAESYAPGKLHGPLMELDGWLYFIGYRGSRKFTTEEFNYRGDWMVRYRLSSGETQVMGIPVPHSSVPSSIIHAPSGIMYGLTATGAAKGDVAAEFFAYDMQAKKLLYIDGPRPNIARSVLLAADGRVYYSHSVPAQKASDKESKTAEAFLVRYDGRTNKVQATAAKVPGNGMMRAASRVDSQGVAYGISQDGVVFAFDTNSETITELTKAFVVGRLYTTTCRLDPSDTYLYYIPSAHGGSSGHGTAVIQLNVKTGRRKVIAFLNDYIRSQKNYNLGGTFGIALSKDGSRLFVCFNGKDLPAPEKKADFGLASAIILHIPPGER